MRADPASCAHGCAFTVGFTESLYCTKTYRPWEQWATNCVWLHDDCAKYSNLSTSNLSANRYNCVKPHCTPNGRPWKQWVANCIRDCNEREQWHQSRRVKHGCPRSWQRPATETHSNSRTGSQSKQFVHHPSPEGGRGCSD